MILRKGNTLLLEQGAALVSSAAVVGRKEGEGPLADSFDRIVRDPYAGQKSWEKAESELQKQAVTLALQKANLPANEIDVMLSGDLINQCTPSCYAAAPLGIPMLGLFGACSTAAESLALGSLMVESGAAGHALCLTSSHFCTAERQFRTPLAYGGQRSPTAQWTVTGAGAFVLAKEGALKIKGVCIGRPVDMGVRDVSNMGAAMAPAACDTLTRFFRDTGKAPCDFDLILTGDLGSIGHRIVGEQMSSQRLPLGERYEDCGLLVYDVKRQDMHAGGSGCGCSAVVLAGHVISKMKQGLYSNVLLAGTGALMSPMSLQQGDAIVGIAHLIWLSTC